ncbi:SPOR domain-containing protein [Thalassococcus lentus]|uniref:SPOR domain-containing protein n=1 Tax=Thalassococcus lentus TaxID=1210524 RepID=A0ABT4XSQ7_9RHOB|nr:SPOR domain-containing protein [Thalassococcus lentus]MDA7424937.1 SPOR domain-containing protein [Thalassococcus lentus]
MTLKSLTIIALFTSSLGIVSGAATAQERGVGVPVNFPPEGYRGRQFVDNNGCVFVRAGFDGAVTWVPRVSRQRKAICGQKPSFAGATASGPAPSVQKPVQITLDAAPAPAPAPAAVAAAKLTPKPEAAPTPTLVPKKTKVQRTVTRAPASKPQAAQPPRVVRRVPTVAPAAPAPKVAVAPKRMVKKAPVAAGRMVDVAPYRACKNGQTTRVVDGQTLAVRCGPQKAPHVTILRRGEPAGNGKNVYRGGSWQGSNLNLNGNTRIVPRHVYEQRTLTAKTTYVPEGYRPAWDDDRLNPHRANQSVDGYYATQQVWTNTVPRKLVTQVRRHKVKDPVIVGRAADAQAAYVSTKGAAQREPVVATRSAPKPVAGKSRYVQIGLFTTEAKARAAAGRLTSAGLPVKMGTVKRNGKTMRSLVVGPYANGGQANAALAAVHGVGYTQARLR